MALYTAKGSLKIQFYAIRLQLKKYSTNNKYKAFYNILEIPEDSDQEVIRNSYLDKVKRYHPDSGHPDANMTKFQQVDTAFRTLMNEFHAGNIQVNVEVEEDDDRELKHKPIQHRQYLSYDGVGSGTPFQREKQYGTYKATQALDNVIDHRISKVETQEKTLTVPKKHKIRTKVHLGRFVEDLIQESISKGALKNLPGEGKPLKDRSPNPHVDFVTQKMNEILIENGYQPKWIMLHKEIRDDVNSLRNKLYMERTHFNPYPLSVEENIEWSNAVHKHKNLVNAINSKIETFNLLVPLWRKQLLMLNLSKEAQKALIEGKDKTHFLNAPSKKENISNIKCTNPDNSPTIFSFIEKIFIKTK